MFDIIEYSPPLVRVGSGVQFTPAAPFKPTEIKQFLLFLFFLLERHKRTTKDERGHLLRGKQGEDVRALFSSLWRQFHAPISSHEHLDTKGKNHAT